jgi:hypothetical protein
MAAVRREKQNRCDRAQEGAAGRIVSPSTLHSTDKLGDFASGNTARYALRERQHHEREPGHKIEQSAEENKPGWGK